MTTTTETGTLRYRHSPDVLWRAVGDTVLLMVRPDREILSLMGSGSALWHLLASPLSIHESATLLAREYKVPAEDIARDIEPVVESLSSHGVLVAEVQEP